MSLISVAMKALDAVARASFLFVVFVMATVSLAATARGITSERLDSFFLGMGLSLGTVHYYFWRHPTKPWRPTRFKYAIAFLASVFLVLAALFIHGAP
jgi:uncharacterized membrane-anchored protein